MPPFMTLRERIDTITDDLMREPKVFSGVLSNMIEKKASGKAPARVLEIAAQIEKVAGVDSQTAVKMAWQTYLKYINPEFVEKHAGELPPWLKKDKDDDKDEKGKEKDDKKKPESKKDEKKDEKKEDKKDEKKEAEIEKESASVFAAAAAELREKLAFPSQEVSQEYQSPEALELAEKLGEGKKKVDDRYHRPSKGVRAATGLGALAIAGGVGGYAGHKAVSPLVEALENRALRHLMTGENAKYIGTMAASGAAHGGGIGMGAGLGLLGLAKLINIAHGEGRLRGRREAKKK